jgi:flagellar protein FlaG
MMDNAVLEIKPLGVGPSVSAEYRPREAKAIKPVPKGEGKLFQKTSREVGGQQAGEASAAIGPEQTRELVESVKNYLSDLNTSLSFEVHEKTGELVMKVVDQNTGEVIRQIPAEDLLQLHEKLEELRGILFSSKA